MRTLHSSEDPNAANPGDRDALGAATTTELFAAGAGPGAAAELGATAAAELGATAASETAAAFAETDESAI